MHLHRSVKVDAFAWIGYPACMNGDPSEAAILAWARLMRSSRHVLGAIEADLKQAGFPPLEWYDALLELKRAPEGLRPVALESRLLLAQHNVSRLLDRLARAGHVERLRCEKDGRGYDVRITPAGRELLAAMWPVYRAAIQRHVGCRLEEREAATLAELLGRLTAVRSA